MYFIVLDIKGILLLPIAIIQLICPEFVQTGLHIIGGYRNRNGLVGRLIRALLHIIDCWHRGVIIRDIGQNSRLVLSLVFNTKIVRFSAFQFKVTGSLPCFTAIAAKKLNTGTAFIISSVNMVCVCDFVANVSALLQDQVSKLNLHLLNHRCNVIVFVRFCLLLCFIANSVPYIKVVFFVILDHKCAGLLPLAFVHLKGFFC